MNKIIKTIFGETWLYCALRSCWYRHLRAVPRRRLQKYGLEIIRRVEAALRQSNVKFFADYGTLLGAIRDHGFIVHDDDIDYSVIAGSIAPAELFSIISKCDGLSFSHAFEYHGQITEMTFLYRKIEVDFFFVYNNKNGNLTCPSYEPIPGQPYNRSYGSPWRALSIERDKIDEIIDFDFKGVRLSIPKNYTTILRQSYGCWERPIEGWQASQDYGQKPYVRFSDCSTVVDCARVREIGLLKCAALP